MSNRTYSSSLSLFLFFASEFLGCSWALSVPYDLENNLVKLHRNLLGFWLTWHWIEINRRWIDKLIALSHLSQKHQYVMVCLHCLFTKVFFYRFLPLGNVHFFLGLFLGIGLTLVWPCMRFLFPLCNLNDYCWVIGSSRSLYLVKLLICSSVVFSWLFYISR